MVSISHSFDDRSLRTHLERSGFTSDTIETNLAIGDQCLPLLAFSHRPFDTRTACLTAAAPTVDRERFLKCSRAAGAPIAFVGSGDRFDIYRQSSDAAELLWTPERGRIREFFDVYRDEIDPRSLFRAKVSRGTIGVRQSTFVEAGLLEIIEGEVSAVLCQLVENMVVTTSQQLSLGYLKDLGEKDAQWLVKANFWLLAARLLQDKEVHGFKTLDLRGIENVFARVGRHYGTPMDDALSPERQVALLEAAQLLEAHSSLRLVSTETLARVYENVLVTKETRKALGTHSTPAWLVEYIVERLSPWISEQSPDEMRVFEPGCGHAPFLVALLRHFCAAEPCLSMADAERHEWLKARLHGAEVDDFAREVARLSMTLADIPNANGWHLNAGDMFTNRCLESEIQKANIIVSNPPFEARDLSSEGPDNISKLGQDAELLRLVDKHAKPGTIFAYVMRQTILDSGKFVDLRKSLLRNFEWLEVLRLPDKVFDKADVETAILIGRRTEVKKTNNIQFKNVWDGQIARFRAEGLAKSEQLHLQADLAADDDAKIFVPDLSDVWEYLKSNPALKSCVSIGRGFEYRSETDPLYPKGESKISKTAREGYEPGFFNMRNSVLSHLIPPITFMLKDEAAVRRPLAGFETGVARVIMSHARVGRGAWRNLAYLDDEGHFTRSRFLVVTPIEGKSASPLFIWALLNSPVANAYTRSFSSRRDILAEILYELPLPNFISAVVKKIEKSALAYRKAAEETNLINRPKSSSKSSGAQEQLDFLGSKTAPSEKKIEQLKYLHWKMDAAILAAYDLPRHLEAQLLNYFQGQSRGGVPFEQTEYFPADFQGGETLADLLAISGDWSKTNKKRLKLIDREIKDGLSEKESWEFERLQELATLRRRLIDPYPMTELDAQIEQMKREGKWTE